MTTPDPKILDLIQKLHNLATGKGATEAEASNAMEKMQALLFKHNLTTADVSMGKTEQPRPGVGETTASIDALAKQHFGGRIIRPNERRWMSDLARSVAQYNFGAVIGTRDLTSVHFVGSAENVAAIMEIWEYAVEQVIDLAQVAYKLSGSDVDHRVWKRNFSNGCVVRLAERLKESWDKLKAQSAQSTALVVYNDKAVSDYVRAHSVPSRAAHRGRSQAGRADGYAAGNRVNLGARPASLGSSTKMLG